MNTTSAGTLPFVPKKIKSVTRPTLRFEVGKPIYIRIEEAMHVGTEITGRRGRPANPDDRKREPATVCNVVDLTTGEDAQIVCAAIVKSSLNEGYPNDGYVGKCFAITKGAAREGKDYNPYAVVEIEDPAAQAKPVGGKK